jgi:hypothetical protein
MHTNVLDLLFKLTIFFSIKPRSAANAAGSLGRGAGAAGAAAGAGEGDGSAWAKKNKLIYVYTYMQTHHAAFIYINIYKYTNK